MRPRSGAGSAATTAAGTDGPPAATASGTGRPRLTSGAVRFKNPILDYRFDDLTAI
jgi:hypothetical protein